MFRCRNAALAKVIGRIGNQNLRCVQQMRTRRE
jgi:hypothetical protein